MNVNMHLGGNSLFGNFHICLISAYANCAFTRQLTIIYLRCLEVELSCDKYTCVHMWQWTSVNANISFWCTYIHMYVEGREASANFFPNRNQMFSARTAPSKGHSRCRCTYVHMYVHSCRHRSASFTWVAEISIWYRWYFAVEVWVHVQKALTPTN